MKHYHTYIHLSVCSTILHLLFSRHHRTIVPLKISLHLTHVTTLPYAPLSTRIFHLSSIHTLSSHSYGLRSPGDGLLSSIPPRFKWDIRTVPGTDDVVDQKPYEKAVGRWCKFHDNLDNNNADKLKDRNRGVCILSNLFDRAKDLVSDIEAEIIDSDDAVQLIMDRIVKRDPLSVTSLVFAEQQSLRTSSIFLRKDII